MADFTVKPKIEPIDKTFQLENQDYVFAKLLIELTEEIKELRAALKRLSERMK